MRRMFGKQKTERSENADRSLPAWLQHILDGVADAVSGPQESVQEIMTYEEALSFFITHQPEGTQPSKGVLIREPRVDGYLVIWGFLNANDELLTNDQGAPCVHQQLVKSLDDELQQAFGDRNTIIIQ